MRLNLSLTTALVIVIALALAACNKSSERQQAGANPAAPPADGVRRVTIAELRPELERGEAVLVDVRGGVEYDLGHIKGAISMPLGLIAERAKELPPGKLLVTYCACTHEQLSVRAVQEMKKVGVENAAALLGGLDEWKRQ